MRLTKKIIAAAAALAMTMTSMTGVFADTIEGGADYVNTTVYKVTLPTTNGMSFTLDPQGLLTSTNGAFGTTGTVTSAGVMVAKNESSVDVTFSAKFYVECATSTSVVAASDANVGASATSTKEAVALQIAVDDSKASSAVSASTTPAALSAVVASTTVTDVTSVSSAAASAISDVTLTKATYKVTGDAVSGFDYVKDPATDDATFVYMAITGKVNPNADWSAYAKGNKTIKLNAVFGFKNADGEDIQNEIVVSNSIRNGNLMAANGKYSTLEDIQANGKFADGATLTSFSANGIEISGAAMQNGYVVVSSTTVLSALGLSSAAELAGTTFYFTVDGVNYATNYSDDTIR